MRRGLVDLGGLGDTAPVPNQQEGPLPLGSLFSQLLGQNLSWGWGMGEEWRHTCPWGGQCWDLQPLASHTHTPYLLHPQCLWEACPGSELA